MVLLLVRAGSSRSMHWVGLHDPPTPPRPHPGVHGSGHGPCVRVPFDGHTSVVVEISPREAEVLELVGEHLTNPEIAERLFISIRTVESHVSSLLRKLDQPDRRSLATLAADRAAADPDGEVGTIVMAGAPPSFTSFVGRGDDLAAVTEALGSARLVTLTGPGGIGKTRLAIEVGRSIEAERSWFVD